MLLEKIVEIIELTDTDSISEALETYNKCGVVSNVVFPYMDVIFDRAPKQLCSKFKQVGFKGMVNITKISTDSMENYYAVYNPIQHSKNDAQSWLKKNFLLLDTENKLLGI